MKTISIAISVSVAWALTLIGLSSAAASCIAPQTQAALNVCAHQDYEVSKAKLSVVYQGAMAKQNRGHRKAMASAQEAWISYRDRACTSYALMADGGTIQPLLFSNCLADLTVSRTQMLEVQSVGLGQ